MKTEANPSPVPDSLLRALQHSPAGSDAQFQILAETTPAAVFVYQDRRIVFANPATEQLSGFTRQELRNTDFLKSLMPQLRRLARPTALGEQRARYEVKFTAKNGSERWLDVTTGPLSYNGAPALLAVAMDITGRKETERKLSVQNAYLEKLFESAPQAIVIIDEKSVILRANRRFEILFGHPREDILGQQLEPLIVPPEKLQESVWLSAKSLQGEDINIETVRRRRDGTLVDVAVQVSAVDLGSGRMAQYCIYRDITGRKRAQEALQRSEAHFRTLVESVSDGIVIIGLDGVVLYENPSIARMLGYTAEHFVGKNAFEIVHPDDMKQGFAGFDNGLNRPRNRRPVQVRLRSHEGEWRPFEILGNRLEEHGKITGLVVSCRDMTERRRTEQALQESETKFRAVAETARTGLLIFGADKILYVNPAAEQITGYSRDELLGAHPETIIHPDQRDESRERREARLRGLDVPAQYELKILTKSGQTRWLDYSACVIQFGGDHAVLGTGNDITERKQNEQLQRALYRISEQAAAAVDLESFYQSIHQIVGELIPARNFYIALWDPVLERITLPYFRDEITPHTPGRMCPGMQLIEYVLRSGQPLLATPDVVRNLVEAGEVEQPGNPSMVRLGVPLKIGNSVIGVLALQSSDENTSYGEHEKDILTFVSQHVAGAIQRKRNEEALRESESRYRGLVQSAVYGMYHSSMADSFEYANQALVKMLGYESEEELLRLKLSTDVYANPSDRDYLVEKYRKSHEIATAEIPWKRKDGQIIRVRAAGRARTNDRGETIGFEMIVEDITERRNLEEQLRQSQKMEAVGRLAGGIAHDFNNLLTVVKGYSELLLSEMHEGHPLRADADEIKKAADRAVALTRQLLAFSRRQVLEAKVLDLNSIIVNMDKLLRPLLREDIELHLNLQPGLGNIKADPGQIEQVIMNLAVNARDAMPGGGRLKIETSEANVEHRTDMKPGRYVVLSISDTGIGMNEVIRVHAFEPFFTTKEMGKGTGLGLSTVYGIVKQSGGYIWIESEQHMGTVFRIYLPWQAAESAEPVKAANVSRPAPAAETVLLVEDEDGVRTLVKLMLERQGYTVVHAKNGAEAMMICEQHAGNIDLLITDVVLEHLSGRELAGKLVDLRPTMRTLYISGYTDDAIVHHGVLSSDMAFLQKPFTAEALLDKVRQLLDARA